MPVIVKVYALTKATLVDVPQIGRFLLVLRWPRYTRPLNQRINLHRDGLVSMKYGGLITDVLYKKLCLC